MLPIFHIINNIELIDSLNKHLEMEFVSMGMHIFTFERYLLFIPIYSSTT